MCANDTQLAGIIRVAVTDLILFRYQVKLDPGSFRSLQNALCTQNGSVNITSGKFLKSFFQNSLVKFMGGLTSPAGEHFICMVMSMMVMAAAALMIVVMMMFMIMVVMAALVVMVMMMLMVMATALVFMVMIVMLMVVVMILVIVVMMMLMVVVVMAALVIMVMMMLMVMAAALVFFLFFVCFDQVFRMAGILQCMKKNFFIQLIPGSGDHSCLVVVLTQQMHTLVQFFLGHILGTADHDGACALYLI